MNGTDVVLIVIAALMVPLAGVLAGMEAALVRVSRARVEEMERGGDRRAARLLVVLADLPRHTNLLLLLRLVCETLATVLVAQAVIDWLGSDYFAPGEHGAFSLVHDSLMKGGDPFMVLADFRAYSDCQKRVDAVYRDRDRWARMAIFNTARVGKFSSDRTIREYANDIWRLAPVPVP